MGRRDSPASASDVAAERLLLPVLSAAARDSLDSGRDAMMAEVTVQNGGREPTAQAAKEAKQRLHDLATSADQRGVSFSGAALHREYFSSKYALRGELLHRSMDAALRQHPQLLPLLSQPGGLRVVSLGGGPACELAGLCSLLRARRERGRAPAQCTLFDLEVRRSGLPGVVD